MAEKKGRHQPARPLGITLLVIVQFVTGLQLLVEAARSLYVFFSRNDPEIRDAVVRVGGERLAENAGLVFLILGLAFFSLGVLSLQLVRGYARGREAARTRGRKVAIFGILVALVGIFILPGILDPSSPWRTLLLDTCIAIYLGRPAVLAYFRPCENTRR